MIDICVSAIMISLPTYNTVYAVCYERIFEARVYVFSVSRDPVQPNTTPISARIGTWYPDHFKYADWVSYWWMKWRYVWCQ